MSVGTFLRIRLILPIAVFACAAGVFLQSGFAAGSGSENPTRIACLHRGEFRYLVRPTSCAFFARQYYPDGHLRRFRDIEGRHLKWTGWGRTVAVGVGVDIYELALTVEASDRIQCPDGDWYYGKVLAHVSVGRDQHLRLARCGAKRFPPLKASEFLPHAE